MGRSHLVPRADRAGPTDQEGVIGAEPSPAPIVAAAAATRAHRWAAAIAALRDLWPVAWSGGRPWAVRMSAAAIVLAVAVGAGSVGGIAAAGAWNLLNQHRTPIVAPIASPEPGPLAGTVRGAGAVQFAVVLSRADADATTLAISGADPPPGAESHPPAGADPGADSSPASAHAVTDTSP